MLSRVSDCAICAKHGGTGELGGVLILRTPAFWVYHAPPDDHGMAPLGYLFIESDRHAAYLDDLTDEESAALGRLRTALARALRRETGATFVFAAVIGTGVAHFHEHLICRHVDTPSSVSWHESAHAAPRADGRAVNAFAKRLRSVVSD